MGLQELKISGYRGFATSQAMEFAVPNGEAGSGLTLITGSNNSGKSSIIEALRARGGHQPPSFTTGMRNGVLDEVEISYRVSGVQETLRSLRPGTSESKRSSRDDFFQIFILPSRRGFSPYFGKSSSDRANYVMSYGSLPSSRAYQLSGFESRLFKIEADPTEFNKQLALVLGFEPRWSIDLSDQGQYFLKFVRGAHSHTSDGLGEGIVSIFAIVDALYDSSPDSMVVIDEPELSLHPSLQKRLAKLLMEYARDRQIVLATHSPYFVDLAALSVGAHLVRVKTDETVGTTIHQLSAVSKAFIDGLVRDINNPHVLGINARELFFQEDGVILTEGQEDVVLYPEVFSQLGIELPGSFFGWGVGGADKMEKIAAILKDLGFQKVAGILDGDKEALLPSLQERFPDYHFVTIPAKDVRTKTARKATEAVDGLLDDKRVLRPEYVDRMKIIAAELVEKLR